MKANSLKTIAPYRWNGGWVFDDPEVKLKREAFVSGADAVCEALSTVDGVPHDRFTLIFSELEFPGAQVHLRLKRVEKVGQTYKTDNGEEVWLCPALLLYFEKPPKHIYAQAKHHVKFARRRNPDSHPWQAYPQHFSRVQAGRGTRE